MFGFARLIWDGGAPPEGGTSREEDILAALNQDLEPIPPDGSRQKVPEQQEFNEDLNPRLDLTEATKEEELTKEELLDELSLLKQFKLDKYTKIEDALSDLSKARTQRDDVADLMKKAGLEVSDDPLQDLADMIEAKLAEDAGLVSGTHTPKVSPSAPPPAAPTPPAAQRTGDGTRNFMARYPTLKWTEPLLQDLAAALREHMEIPSATKTDDFVSKNEIRPMAKMNQHLFEQAMIQDHIIARMSNGEKLPPNYRAQLTEQVQKNPQLMERAIRGYLIRGRAGDVMSEYAKAIPAAIDPSTGLTQAEKDAQAEQLRLEASKRTIRGGDTPGKTGAPRNPSLRDLELSIERAGKKII